VAANISDDEEFMAELSRLSSSFEIGVIKIDIEDLDSSEIILQAEYHDELDWETMNKLSANADFREFVTRVKNDLATGEIRKEGYDRVLERDNLINSIRRAR